ncbi:MAG: DUF1080 domain-containing protein [Planctomycetia bacterium]|nr:DUF1080 domain-containing protein [Planctomycetia bacterium]
MLPLHRLLAVAFLSAACAALLPATEKPKSVAIVFAADDFKPLFNGKDFTGWVNVNCHPDTFFIKDNTIITTGKPTGFLRTEKQYENFVLEMDWMHVNKKEVGNSGLFVWGDPLPAVGTPYTRGIEVQVLVNLEYKNKEGKVTASSHGDVFAIHGAKCVPDRPHPGGSMRCIPSEYRAKGGGEWNHYKVTANDGVIKLEVNGKEVSGVSKCTPRKGYLALESEGAECHFKNIKIKELPSTNPKPEETATVWAGHKSIFNGLDLKGWKTADESWKVAGGHLKSSGKALLVSDAKYATGELVFDWKVPAKSSEEIAASLGGTTVTVATGGKVKIGVVNTQLVVESVETKVVKPGAWNRTVLTFEGKMATVRINGEAVGKVKSENAPPAGPIVFHPAEGLEIMNVFYRELKEKK